LEILHANESKTQTNIVRARQRSVQLKKSLAFLIAAILCDLCLQPAAFGANGSEWRMTQKHHMNGISQVYFTGNAIKIVGNRGAHYVSKAPDWDVNVFRLDDKAICHLTRQQFYKKANFHLRRRELQFAGTGSVCSRKTNLFRDEHRTYWVAKFPGVSLDIAKLLSAYYKSQAVDGMLLKSFSSNRELPAEKERAFKLLNDRSTGVTLETLNLRAIPYNPSDFNVPTGFRTVSDLRQVLLSSKDRNDAESIFLDMGVGDELGKREPKKAK
jgi:hypothetical protein